MTRVIQLSDREVLLTEDIGPVIKAWVDRNTRQYRGEWASAGYGRDVDCFVHPFTPLARLACESKTDARDIYAIINQERNSVDFYKADRILHAIDESVHHFDAYPANEVNAATMEQTEILRNVARARGDYIPPDKRAKTVFPKLRKRYQRAA